MLWHGRLTVDRQASERRVTLDAHARLDEVHLDREFSAVGNDLQDVPGEIAPAFGFRRPRWGVVVEPVVRQDVHEDFEVVEVDFHNVTPEEQAEGARLPGRDAANGCAAGPGDVLATEFDAGTGVCEPGNPRQAGRLEQGGGCIRRLRMQ